MSKAARNRAKRREKLLSRGREIVRDAVGELLQLEDFDTFMRLLARYPQLLERPALEEVADMAQAPGYGPLIAMGHRLLCAARIDPEVAWDAYERDRRAMDARGKELGAQEEEIDAAESAGDLPRVLEMIDCALPIAIEIGFGLSVCELLHQRGRALTRLGTARRAEELEEALESFEAALEVAVPGEQAARILMHRGLAYGERVKGDPSQNIERAIVSLRDALAQLALSAEEDEELRAMMKTNLAVALVRSEGDRLVAAREAAELCREALEYRNPRRDANNWAYTQINLGYALQVVSELGDGDWKDASAAYEVVLDYRDAITDRALLGGAYHALGRHELSAASQSPERIIQADATGQLDELFDDTDALNSAREHLTAALALTPKDPDTLRYVRILDDLARALNRLDEDEDALVLSREGLALVNPQSAPVTCKNLAWRVGTILSKREDWLGAAIAFRSALEAAEITVNARLNSAARAGEIRSAGNLHRWAAYAFARAGEPQAAAVALDSGRARELQRRLGLHGEDEDALVKVPATLRARYEHALAAFVTSPIDATDTDASRRLGETIAEIRDLSGLADFHAGARWSEIVAAVEPAWPLVYVNPTPHGTMLLILHRSRDGELVAEARFIGVTSTEVWMHMFVNGGQLEGDEPTGSYVVAASGQGTDRDVAGGLDQLLPWLSGVIAAPFATLLESVGARAATLVLCGPIDMAPLHAAPLPSTDGVLSDCFELRFAPSATVCATAITRGRRASELQRRLVALADPDGSLPAAGPEVEEIAAVFEGDTTACAVGADATLEFLKRHAAHASHLHFACHARSGLFDASEAVIELASGPLPASALTTVARLNARLVVVSACQSAQSTMGGLLQAEFSIAAALLAAGSACVIASLWPVDDLATALLMTRLYHELRHGTIAPPRALRSAQAWLRALSEEQEREFLDRHPKLAAEYARRLAQGSPPGRRGEPAPHAASGTSRPYAHPDYWSAFIAVGV